MIRLFSPPKHLLLFASFLIAANLPATVWTYPAPAEQFRSPDYLVTVTQAGQTHTSFVYRHAHQDAALRDRGTDFNHWTTFSFSEPITVTVTRLRGEATGATILPSARQIQPTTAGRTATFTLDRPAKLYVRFPDAPEDPLFIFADAPEENIPDRHDPNVIWFEAGKITDIGERFPVKSGQTVYIPGGAYVTGSITATAASRVTIRGRGVLSGYGYARRPNIEGIPYNTVMFDGPGTDQLVEGITITNPMHFCLLSRGTFTARNVKLFGWWHQTDGWGGGDNSVVEDSFMKVNDDSVKFYGKNQIARNLVIWQQVNGAPFQLGWGGAGQSAQNCLAENIDMIACESLSRGPGERTQTLLNLRNQSPESVIDGVTMRNIRVDGDMWGLLGLGQVKGRVRNIVFDNVTIKGSLKFHNFIRVEDNGSVEGIRVKNVRTQEGPLDATRASSWLTTGRVAPVEFLP